MTATRSTLAHCWFRDICYDLSNSSNTSLHKI